MNKFKCNAITASGTRCQNPVGEGDTCCSAGHIPILAQVDQARGKNDSVASGRNQITESGVKFDITFRGDWTSWIHILLLIPLLIISAVCLIFSLLPLFLVLWNIMPGHWLVPVVAYYAVGLLFFVPPIENFMWQYLDRSVRQPTVEERQKLEPAWNDIIATIGKGRKRRYSLRVAATDNLNAYAFGGRQVTITQGALQHLNDSELRGIIAHELGHHAGLHPVLGLATYWMIKPIRWAHLVSIKLRNISILIVQIARNNWILWVALILAFLLTLVAYALLAIVYLSELVLLWFSRRHEYRSDKIAVLMGFGEGLLSSLYIFQELEYQEGHIIYATIMDKMLSNTHPPIEKRITRVQSMLKNRKMD